MSDDKETRPIRTMRIDGKTYPVSEEIYQHLAEVHDDD